MNRTADVGTFAGVSLGGTGVKTPSFVSAVLGDMFLLLAVVTCACGLAGIADDVEDSLMLVGFAATVSVVGGQLRRRYERPRRTPPGRILAGLSLIWGTVCVVGAVAYLVTGTIDRLDDALLESTAGFTTTNLTTLDPARLSDSMLLWRASTQFVGGYMALLVMAIALPEALRDTALAAPRGRGRSALVTSVVQGRRRIFGMYAGFTAIVAAAYGATGLGGFEAVATAMATSSTGGFSANADSFVQYGSATRTVATIAMVVAGSSIFIIWWAIKGETEWIWKSSELRAYLAIVAVAAVALLIDVDGLAVGDALFVAASAASTTGFAMGDWAIWSDDAEGVLLVVVATGAMLGSAAGGLTVDRAQLLVRFAGREMRRQLDRHAVVVIKHRGSALSDRAVDQVAGFQISHLVICGVAALAMASLGVGVLGSIWGATSAVSTFGPAVGEIGSYGSVEELAAPPRLVLIGAMLAGRLAIVPAVLAVTWGLRSERVLWRRARRMTVALRRALRGGKATRSRDPGGHSRA